MGNYEAKFLEYEYVLENAQHKLCQGMGIL